MSVKQFMAISGTLPPRHTVNHKQLELQIGLVLEEVGELLEAQGNSAEEAACLHAVAARWKSGSMTGQARATLETLDALADIVYVATGAGLAMGADMSGALLAVDVNNITKFPLCSTCHGTGTYRGTGKQSPVLWTTCPDCAGKCRRILKDVNGKILKPEGYKKVSLEPFL